MTSKNGLDSCHSWVHLSRSLRTTPLRRSMNGEHHREAGGVKPGPGLAELERELFGGPVMSAVAGS
jgi:hypothetical protein